MKPMNVVVLSMLTLGSACRRDVPLHPMDAATGHTVQVSFAPPRSVEVVGCDVVRMTPLIDRLSGVIEQVVADSVTIRVSTIPQDPSPSCASASVKVIVTPGVSVTEARVDAATTVVNSVLTLIIGTALLYGVALTVLLNRH